MKLETHNLKHHTVSLQTLSVAAAEGRTIEMARRAENDSRQGRCAIVSSGEAIQHCFSPALVRGNQSEDCARCIPFAGVGCAQEISTL